MNFNKFVLFLLRSQAASFYIRHTSYIDAYTKIISFLTETNNRAISVAWNIVLKVIHCIQG